MAGAASTSIAPDLVGRLWFWKQAAGNSFVTWRHVQAQIARFTRVCAYDRAGLGFSDAATRPSTIANIVDDVHRLLKAAHIATPIVFVGHSLGGEAGLLFAATYPQEIAG